MISGKKVLGLVIARGGSKGLAGKNLLKLGGVPLVCHSVMSGIESHYVDDVVISTDSTVIAEEANKFGAEVPFIRPKELATDDAKSIDVVRHALMKLSEEGREYDIIVLLQAATPFRLGEHVDESLEMLIEKDAISVISVTEAEHPPLWMNTLPDDGNMKDFIRPEAENRNRQDLPKYYRINGGVYAVLTDYLMETGKFYSEKTYAYVMDAESSVDIDSELDFMMAQAYMEKQGRL